MPTNRDAAIKRTIKAIVEKLGLDNLVIDREVVLNLSGDKEPNGNYVSEKEIDVVARFSYGGKNVMLFFECENSSGKDTKTIKDEYVRYAAEVVDISKKLPTVIHSKDGALTQAHFQHVDATRVCFVYGNSFPINDYQRCVQQAQKHAFVVWNADALKYFSKISAILNGWTKYEIFKEFDLNLGVPQTVTISAIKLKQKNTEMYVASAHPGLLLQISYVVRRLSGKTHAYQRMLNRQRIKDIADFISSADEHAFLPNAVIVVFDDDDGNGKPLFDVTKSQLTIPFKYCSAWIVDGQHRLYGFLGTKYEAWTQGKHEPFDLPIVIFPNLNEITQTQTFININYHQKRIKPALLCDLTTLTKDLKHRLTWPSLLGVAINQDAKSPMYGKIKVSEFDTGRPISLASFVQYGLLEGLLGFKARAKTYKGALYTFAQFNVNLIFANTQNQDAFKAQVDLLNRFLLGVYKNTADTKNPATDPWRNTKDFSLLKPTGINALFLVLAKILQKYPQAQLDFNTYLKPLGRVDFGSENIATMGGGWKGFRNLANHILQKLNRGKKTAAKLQLFGERDKT